MGNTACEWSISVKEKNRLINVLTEELSFLRAKACVSQDEISKIIGISRQTYGDIERKKKKMSWSIYLSLILFFDYSKSTHKLIRTLSAFPSCLEKNKDDDSGGNLITNLFTKEISGKLDEQAFHAIKTVIMLEYARCNNLNTNSLYNSFNEKIFVSGEDK